MLPESFAFRGKPYAHQYEEVIGHWLDQSRARFWEMGTGKTYATIHEAAALYEARKIDALIVVAPKGVYRNWERELLDHWPMALWPEVMTWGVTRPSSTWRDDRFAALLINVEALATKRGAKQLEHWLNIYRALLVVDESTSVKNPKAKRTKALTGLACKAVYRRILTGSPVTQSPLDLYAQLSVLTPAPLGFTSFYAFRNRYAKLAKRTVRREVELPDGTKTWRDREFQEVVGHQRLDELQTRLAKISSRVLKEDCLDLPPKVYQRREVELTDEQIHVYEQIKKDARAVLEGTAHVTAAIALTQILRLHQIACGFTLSDEGVVCTLSNLRLDALLDVVDESGDKVIVWAPYVPLIAMLRANLLHRFGPKSVVTYYGATTPDERVEAVERFQSDPTCRFFVGNPQTAGYGLTLTAASTVVYFANRWKLEERMQSEDRAHRIGLDHSVTYVDLVAPGTVDERILEALRSKRDIANEVLGESWREWIQ